MKERLVQAKWKAGGPRNVHRCSSRRPHAYPCVMCLAVGQAYCLSASQQPQKSSSR